MSEPSDEQATGQHHLVCGTRYCEKNGQFYCNDCHRSLCEQCKERHHRNPDTKIHDVVLYRHRKQQLPAEKCKLHPIRNIDIFCKECQIPLCSKCSTKDEHQGHTFDDLEDLYANKYAIWQGEFSKIQKYFLPTSEGLKTDVEEDAKEIRNIMEGIRSSLNAEAECLKNLVDEVTSEKKKHTDTIEKAVLKMLKSQETTYDDYIAYLGKMNDEFQRYLSLTNEELVFSETLKIQSIPETSKPVKPVFIAGQFNKNDVGKLLGSVCVPNKKPEERKIIPMCLSFSDTKISENRVPGVYTACHISVENSGRLWASDLDGNLVQTDLRGNLLQKIQTSGESEGYHTTTKNRDLIYTDCNKKVIYRITLDKKKTEFIKTEDWKPLSIHSSRINGDMQVGMKKIKAKVTRYNKAGIEMQNIQCGNRGQELYDYPHYITENINGDICTSDYSKEVVVVVNKSGQHRFSYPGQGLRFCPYGICTDAPGHILVCDGYSKSVHLLDQEGGFLSVILSQQQGINCPRSVCVDDENNLYVGQMATDTVTVYKYIQ